MDWAHSRIFIKAGSILGLKPSGLECAPDALLEAGLAQLALDDIRAIQNHNHRYSPVLDAHGMLNVTPLRDVSLELSEAVNEVLDEANWPIVLGGDCSVLVGIMAGLKQHGRFGVVTFDAHADFYISSQSPSGEAADMDIALITGRGDERLCNIYGGRPYVRDEDVVHIGQRDQSEAEQYGSARLQDTAAQLMSLDDIRLMGREAIGRKLQTMLKTSAVDGYWLHVDTDVLHDEENPAVDYRLPDGLRFAELEVLLTNVLRSGRVVGMSVAIYNPRLDTGGTAGKHIADMLRRVLLGRGKDDAAMRKG